MKILKYNENHNKEWTKERMERLYDEYYDFGELVLDYLKLIHIDLFNDDPFNYNLENFWFEEDEENFLNVEYKYGYSGNKKKPNVNYVFQDEEFEDLLLFMDNPESYRLSKKYNL